MPVSGRRDPERRRQIHEPVAVRIPHVAPQRGSPENRKIVGDEGDVPGFDAREPTRERGRSWPRNGTGQERRLRWIQLLPTSCRRSSMRIRATGRRGGRGRGSHPTGERGAVPRGAPCGWSKRDTPARHPPSGARDPAVRARRLAHNPTCARDCRRVPRPCSRRSVVLSRATTKA